MRKELLTKGHIGVVMDQRTKILYDIGYVVVGKNNVSLEGYKFDIRKEVNTIRAIDGYAIEIPDVLKHVHRCIEKTGDAHVLIIVGKTRYKKQFDRKVNWCFPIEEMDILPFLTTSIYEDPWDPFWRFPTEDAKAEQYQRELLLWYIKNKVSGKWNISIS